MPSRAQAIGRGPWARLGQPRCAFALRRRASRRAVRRASLAACRARQATPGLPFVSPAAMRSPPSSEAFLKNCIRCAALAPGSVSSQKRCPAKVVGTSEPASTADEIRGALPVASPRAAASWTAALMRTQSTGSVGTGRPTFAPRRSATGTIRSVTFLAFTACPSACCRALTGPATKREARSGRATSLLTVMSSPYPDRSATTLVHGDAPDLLTRREGELGVRRVEVVSLGAQDDRRRVGVEVAELPAVVVGAEVAHQG